MPAYEYICRTCNKSFTVIERISEHRFRQARCPTCGKRKGERIFGNVFAKTSKKS